MYIVHCWRNWISIVGCLLPIYKTSFLTFRTHGSVSLRAKMGFPRPHSQTHKHANGLSWAMSVCSCKSFNHNNECQIAIWPMRLFLLYECISVFLVVVDNLLHCCTITTTLCFSVPFGIVVALNSAVHNKQPLQQQQQLMYFGISENPINPFLEIFSQTLAPSQQMQHSLCLAKELLRDKRAGWL